MEKMRIESRKVGYQQGINQVGKTVSRLLLLHIPEHLVLNFTANIWLVNVCCREKKKEKKERIRKEKKKRKKR